MGVTLVQKHRQAALRRLGQLGLEGLFLIRARREVAIKVQPHLPGGGHLRLVKQGTQLGQGVVIEKSGVVGVNAGGGAQSPVRIIPAQGQGLAGLRHAGAGEQHARDAGLPGPLQHRLRVATKLLVAQIDADVGPLRGAHEACSWPASGSRRRLSRSRRSSTRRRLAPRSQ